MNGREREVKLLAVSREQLDSLARMPSIRGFPMIPLGENRQEDVYLETGDFRLFRAGLSLRYREKAGQYVRTLKEVLAATDRKLLNDRLEMEESVGPAKPDTSAQPGGAVGARIRPLLCDASIGPVVRIRTNRRKFRLGTDPEGGAVLCLDRVEVLRAGDDTPVGGFHEAEVEDEGAGPAAVEAIGEELLGLYGLLPSTLSKYERGLAILGLLGEARGQDRQFDLVLRPEDRLVDSGLRVYRKHFERMKMNEPGTRIGEDPEFLHDMRVSTRRLRAAFRTFRGAFTKARMAGFNNHLRWIAQVLGVVRDLDVYLERLPEYTATLPLADRESLEAFRAHLVKKREAGRNRMLRALETRRYSSFIDRFDRFLGRGAPKRPTLVTARRPVTEAAPLLIQRELKRVLKNGRAIPPVNPPAQSLHNLRILCKRLRYTCEFFSELYGKPMRRFIRSVVTFQDLLGAHQDACVAGDTLREFALRIPGTRKETLRTALVLGQLVSAQDGAAAESRSHFREAWKAFDKPGVRRKMWS